MKNPQQVSEIVRRRLQNSWHIDVFTVGTAELSTPDPTQLTQQNWPHTVALGGLKQSELEQGFDAEHKLMLEWWEHAERTGVELHQSQRRVYGTSQNIATHVTVPSLSVAAAVSGGEWANRIRKGERRANKLRARFPGRSETVLSGVVRAAEGLSDADFELLCTAAEWFSVNDATGLTPRQVPIEGLHAKWLNSRQKQVEDLAGVEVLGLIARHPQRVHFTYLDPEHRSSGERWQDSVSLGDTMRPSYMPELVLIAENKDSAIHFPALPHAISVEGAGSGAGPIPQIPWIVNAPAIVYWGDIDAAGLEIVDQYRRAGVAVQTILMDTQTYDRYARLGSSTDAAGKPLAVRSARAVPTLTKAERELYERLTDPDWAGVRRIEQERIPLDVAADAVRNLSV